MSEIGNIIEQDMSPGVLNKTNEKTHRKTTVALLCLALVFIVLAVYIQVGNHSFINLDDNAYVTNNPHVASGITVQNVVWAFTSVDAYNWHPITWLSHMADVRFFGMNPGGHHITSVVIHTISSLLLFLLLLRLTGALWQSLFVAAMFALHPLHIQSVAWVAERKDVISGFFWFLTLLLYAKYVEKQKTTLYVLTILSFILGLMSKPMLVTLPLVMLLLDFWPLERFRYEGDKHHNSGRAIALIKEKIPFFVCSIFSGVVTIYAQGKGGAIAASDMTSLWLRFENAMTAYVKYIGKTIWPHDLALFYPFPLSIPLWQAICSLLILILFSALAIRARRHSPYVLAGWLWFVITLMPVIGLIQVGGHSMADRYTYIPLTGLFIVAAWGVPDLMKGMRHQRRITALIAATVVITSAILTWQQLAYWRDSVSLFRHTLQVTSGNCMIHNNLGLTLALKGEYEEAIQEFRKALRIYPNYTEAHNNLGATFDFKGDFDAAIQEYREAIRINPDHADAHYNLGIDLQIRGDLDAAIKEYQETLRIQPYNSNAIKKLQNAFAQKWRMQ